MSDSLGVQVHPCVTVEEFLDWIVPPAALLDGGITSTVLYRGTGDSRYELVPSAFRTDDSSKDRVSQIQSIGVYPKNTVDVTVLSLFYQAANRSGLALPYISQHMHESLSVGVIDAEVSGHMFGHMLPVFGLAQHYGLPTRLLDWSFDPFVAAYFAAKEGARKLSDSSEATEIAVWMIQSRFLEPDVHIVHAPYSGNPNLAAQKGAFTFVDAIHDDTPLNVFVTRERKTDRRDFHKYTLPVDAAPNLFFALRRRGYDAARLFPGYSGAAESVKELAMLAQCPQVKKRVFETPSESS